MIRLAAYPLSVVCVLLSVSIAQAQPAPGAIRVAPRNPHEPGWARPILTSEEEREMVEATPIQLRPYRPGHFYGNTIRRRYYRGTAVPIPRDAINGAAAVVGLRPHVSQYLGYAGP